MLGCMERAQVPDAAAFRAFRQRCQDGSWQRDRGGLAVSLQLPPPGCAIHQLKVRAGGSTRLVVGFRACSELPVLPAVPH